MYVNQIQLENFRNYSQLKVKLNKSVNILIGDNAQGKTNILESIYYCSIGKSHRTNKDAELIKLNEKSAYISIYVCKERLDKKIDIKIFKEGKKGINVNSIKLTKISDLMGIFNVVMFAPEDLTIVKGSPSLRRKFLNIELCKLDKKYYYYLSKYKKVLSERNSLLKSDKVINEILDVYDKQLCKYGIYIIKSRIRYMEMLNEEGRSIHKKITSNNEDIRFNYISTIGKLNNISNLDNIKESFYDLLIKNRNKDIKRKNTSIGPHRDDMNIQINGMDARHYASQGQQRTSVLTMKFASLEIIKKLTGEYPVLLLDDVLSELDEARQKYVLNSIYNVQTIITCTGISNIKKYLNNNSYLYKVKNGMLQKIT